MFGGCDRPFSRALDKSFSAIERRYDGLILDLWGVVNDDQKPFPEAIDAIKRMRKTGKRIVFVSNSPHCWETIKDKLSGFGLDYGLHYDGIVTSGDMARLYFQQRQPKGTEYYYFIGGNTRSVDKIFEGMPHFQPTDDVNQASFALCTSARDKHGPEDQHAAELQKLLGRNIKLYNANPDKRTPQLYGANVLCGGIVAEAYRELGGEVHNFGKPDSLIYQVALGKLGEVGVSYDKVLAVGDTLEMDIKGANAVGLDSALVRNRLHTHELHDPYRKPTDRAYLNDMCRKIGVAPTYVVPALSMSASRGR